MSRARELPGGSKRQSPAAAVILGLALVGAGCTAGGTDRAGGPAAASSSAPANPAAPSGSASPTTTAQPSGSGSPQVAGSPSPSPSPSESPSASTGVLAPVEVYAGAGAGDLSATARQAVPRVYVPDSVSNRVQELDPITFKVLRSFPTAREPQHVVPSWDLKTLWVNSDLGDSLLPIDPVTGKPGKPVPVADPYNLYFTPDGAHALVMAERLRRIDVRDPHTMALQRSIAVPCGGVNHADFTADGRFLLASCEFSGKLLVVPVTSLDRVSEVIDLNARRTPGATDPVRAKAAGGPAGSLEPGASAMPQDVRITADGRSFVVADMLRNGVWVIDAHTFAVTRFLPTGAGAHGIYPSRDARSLYVSNRDGASISVLDATASPGPGHLEAQARLVPGHGWGQRRRPSAVAVRPVRQRGLRH